MTTPLSQDLRRRIVRAVEKGNSIRQDAVRYEVSPSAAVKLMRRFRQSGSPAPARFGGHRRPILEPHEALVRALLDTKPLHRPSQVPERPPQSPRLSPCSPDRVTNSEGVKHGGKPKRQGFGSQLIRRSIEGELAGDLAIRFAPNGVAYDISAPLH